MNACQTFQFYCENIPVICPNRLSAIIQKIRNNIRKLLNVTKQKQTRALKTIYLLLGNTLSNKNGFFKYHFDFRAEILLKI